MSSPYFPPIADFVPSLSNLFPSSAPYLLRLYTLDLGYVLVLFIHKHSFIEIRLNSLPPTLFGAACWIFAFASAKATGGSTYWLALPAYVAGVNFLPDANQYFERLQSHNLPATVTISPFLCPPSKTNPKRRATCVLIASTLLSFTSFLIFQQTFPKSTGDPYPWLQYSPRPFSQAAPGLETVHNDSTWALFTYAIWASTSSLTISTSLCLFFATRVDSPQSSIAPMPYDGILQGTGLGAWVAQAVTRHVYLQAYVGCWIVHFCISKLPTESVGHSALTLGRWVTFISAIAIMAAWGVNLSTVLAWQSIQKAYAVQTR